MVKIWVSKNWVSVQYCTVLFLFYGTVQYLLGAMHAALENHHQIRCKMENDPRSMRVDDRRRRLLIVEQKEEKKRKFIIMCCFF